MPYNPNHTPKKTPARKPVRRYTEDQLLGMIESRFGSHGRDGKIHTDCPGCGKEAKRGQTHFIIDIRGGHCFVCSYNASLWKLCVDSGLVEGRKSEEVTRIVVQPKKPKAAPEKTWEKDADSLLKSYLSHPKRNQLWQAYKPVTDGTIEKYSLGVGYVPGWSGLRLIVPVLDENGKMTGVHGRAIREHNVAWATAVGSGKKTMWARDIKPGSVVAITENYVDALLMMQSEPMIDYAVPIGSARRLHKDEMEQIASKSPAVVYVFLDNDLVGQANEETIRILVKRWEANNPGKTINPPLNGYKIRDDFSAMKIKSWTWEWPSGTEPKFDVGSWLVSSQKLASF